MSLQFCEEEIKWVELFDAFQGIYNKSQDIKDVSVLQGIALAREIKEDVSIFLDKVTQIGLKSILCEVLNHYDLDTSVKEVQDYITQLFTEFTALDESISSINKDDFETMDDIESAVAPIFDNFISSKEDIEKIVDEKLAVMFKPLVELGASEQDIKDALEEVEFNDSPSEYIVEVFLNITDRTLQNIQ